MSTLALIFLLVAQPAAQVVVDAGADLRAISPYLYGRNNSLSSDPSQPLPAQDWQRLRDAGVQLFRESGGNNSTKYNWRRKLTSHPDWYNNVYPSDWDFEAQSLQANLPGAQGMWSFQLIGKAAATNAHNFDDWNYNGSQWWEGVTNNWAGGGGPDAGEGDPALYLMDWPADSTVAILDHWFGDGGLGLDPDGIRYWNMDNEPGIWYGTHDDVMTEQLDAEAFMQRYFEVAKKARALVPDIRLVGPVATNEWQWYNWADAKIESGGQRYTWLEYFIKRVGEEQAATGVRLLDVLDLHFYPYETDPADLVQLHRVWFDETYVYPGANGVKRTGPTDWDDSITNEYVMGRARAWLDAYLGPEHGVTFGVSEMGIQGDDPNVTAVWYASTLGVFADEGVELFTPWEWKTGMWEVLHLFSRYGRATSVQATSDLEATVSAHASLSAGADSLTVVLINRSLDQSAHVTVQLTNVEVADGAYPTLALSDLPAGETFVSHDDNALADGSVTVQDQAFGLTLPALSVTAVLLEAGGAPVAAEDPSAEVPREAGLTLGVYPNPFRSAATVAYRLPEGAPVRIDVYDVQGRYVERVPEAWRAAGAYTYELDGTRLPSGVYAVRVSAGPDTVWRLVTLMK